jgi:hypothetical protein
MKQKSVLFILPLIALVLMSCQLANVNITRDTVRPSGDLQSETRSVSGVERVVMEDLGKLTIIQGEEEGLTVEADDNLLPYIESRMRGSELVLEVQNDVRVTGSSTIRYTLRVKDLNRITVAGAGEVQSERLVVDSLDLNVAGSGNIAIDSLETEELRADSSGSGNFSIAGKVNSQNITINGAGNYNAGDLESTSARVTINGAGNITVWSTGTLDIQVNGFGNVSYYGEPEVSQRITGGGGVKGLGEHK